MKHRILLIASAILAVGVLVTSSTRVFAANSKKKVTTQQSLKYFKRIVMSTPYDVHFVQGDKNVVKLVGPQAEGQQDVAECFLHRATMWTSMLHHLT